MIWYLVSALLVVIAVLCGYAIHLLKVIAWVDEREKAMAPLIACVQAIHFAGAPRHSVNDVDGVTRQTLVEVPVPPDQIPEGENWVVAGDRVFVKKAEFVPSTGGLRQMELVIEMEQARESLVNELRKQYNKLAEWEKEHPVP